MQFLRKQRKGRKRKSYLERIGLDEKIKSADVFYDKYIILNKLQTGGQGTIYSINCKQSDEKKLDEIEGNETKNNECTLVVKIVSLNEYDSEEIPNQLVKAWNKYQLISTEALLNHHGIYYDTNKKQLLIVTDKLKMNLDELKYCLNNENKLNEPKLKCIMTDILYKIHILHESGHSHNDITPFNLMCDYNDKWTLIDYDMILKIDEKRGYTKDCWTGTIGWVAKEIGHDINSCNNKYSYSSDLWSFGMILLYILNDFTNPFDITQNEIIQNQLNNEDDKLAYYYRYKMTQKECENKVKYLLTTWLAKDKISFELYDLLLNHLLVFNVLHRTQYCKDIVYHPWFYQYIKQNKEKYQFHTQGEINGY